MILVPDVLTHAHGLVLLNSTSMLMSLLTLLSEINMLQKREKENAK